MRMWKCDRRVQTGLLLPVTQAEGTAGNAWARSRLARLARSLPRPGFLAGSASPLAALRIRRRLPNMRGKNAVIGGSQFGPSEVAGGGDY